MTNIQSTNKFNLEDRTLDFAKSIIKICQILPNNIVNNKLVDQMIRSAGSVGANYREANDSLGNKDFVLRLRISRKEAKETIFWLQLVQQANPTLSLQIVKLIDECTQIRNILSSIIIKITRKNA
ncbi:MAG: four helix bundle protein [Candidatus Shapirobacteria bacterium]|jgi:four helix bundle protein